MEICTQGLLMNAAATWGVSMLDSQISFRATVAHVTISYFCFSCANSGTPGRSVEINCAVETSEKLLCRRV